jgi:MraZ protein
LRVNQYHSRHFQTIDDKGRIVLPGKLRRVAESETGTTGEKLQFFMRYLDGGLALFTAPVWRPIVEYYLAMNNLEPEQRERKRIFFSAVEDVACDKQGRITIPAHLREKAGLKDSVVIVGVGDHIEVWSAQSFSRLEESIDAPLGGPRASEGSTRVAP